MKGTLKWGWERRKEALTELNWTVLNDVSVDGT